MDLTSFYNCSLFNKHINDLTNFSFIQEELILSDVNNKNKFEKISVEYKCKFFSKTQLGTKPVAIICTKDSTQLMKFTLDKIKTFNILSYIDLIVVDDRSIEDIKSICDEFGASYLRVDNQKGFNFSTLNNIAAKIAYDAGCDTIILWNNDLWPENEQTIKELLTLHKEHNSIISGTKLLYPNFSWNGSTKTPENILQHFKEKSDTYRGTVQFGGALMMFNSNFNTYFPNHFKRFAEKSDLFVNSNKLDFFITGAFQIINLEWFIKIGGLNPSLSKNFQDVDICFRAVKDKKPVYYFGKDLYLCHDESVTISKNKFDKQFFSDHILYSKIWNMENFLKHIFSLE